MWLIPEGHTPQELLETSLKRTGVTYFDQYLLHNLNQENWEICKKENLVDFIFAKRRQGRFGMPASPSMIRRRFCMKFWMPPTGTLFSSRSIIMTGKRPSAQRNNMKWLRPAAFPASSWSRARRLARFAASRRGLSAYRCRPKGKPGLMGAPVCREPSQYGSRTQRYVRHGAGNRKSPALWPVSAAQHSGNRAAPAGGIHLESLPLIPCTGCNYCKGCPKGVRISSAFEAYNSCLRFDQMADLRARIQSCGIADCIECGKCEGHCPQHIAIPKELKRVLACAEAEAIG